MTTELSTLKAALRATVKERIDALDTDYISLSDRLIYSRVLELPEIKNACQVFLYFSIGREIDTRNLIETLTGQGIDVMLPVSRKNGLMSFHRYEGNMEKGLLGIPCPSAGTPPAIPLPGTPIIVPAMSYDIRGYRMGKGGGYYDRYLAGYDMLSIGLVREKLLLPSMTWEPHDIPVKILITENMTARLR
ncbi:MAG: 5-formyltetrahydrofolate cyclo-ligase [Clostridiales bacterium]|nr:5-formyltetrahydrofolate cyclo-ligase [Clostridiales bacterium]